jgi:predicted nucleic acid-binding Zn ribbon protein
MSVHCVQCGAFYPDDDRSCAERFAELLALDHSRQEPWGSRHGLAFAAYALQHPAEYAEDVRERAWIALYRIYHMGDDVARVFAALRRQPVQMPKRWSVPPLPAAPRQRARFDVTIADLGDFEAEGYPERVDAWCRATLAGWGAEVTASR